MIIAFLISFLWFRINGLPLFPVGFLAGLVIAYWSHDINRGLGRDSLITPTVIIAVVGMIIGLIIT